MTCKCPPSTLPTMATAGGGGGLDGQPRVLWRSVSVGIDWKGGQPATPAPMGFSQEDERDPLYFANISSFIKEILITGRYRLNYSLYAQHGAGGGASTSWGTELLVGPGQTAPVKFDADGLAPARAYVQAGEEFICQLRAPMNLFFTAGDRLSVGVYRADGAGGPSVNTIAGVTQSARSFWEMIYLGA